MVSWLSELGFAESYAAGDAHQEVEEVAISNTSGHHRDNNSYDLAEGKQDCGDVTKDGCGEREQAKGQPHRNQHAVRHGEHVSNDLLVLNVEVSNLVEESCDDEHHDCEDGDDGQEDDRGHG